MQLDDKWFLISYYFYNEFQLITLSLNPTINLFSGFFWGSLYFEGEVCILFNLVHMLGGPVATSIYKWAPTIILVIFCPLQCRTYISISILEEKRANVAWRKISTIFPEQEDAKSQEKFIRQERQIYSYLLTYRFEFIMVFRSLTSFGFRTLNTFHRTIFDILDFFGTVDLDSLIRYARRTYFLNQSCIDPNVQILEKWGKIHHRFALCFDIRNWRIIYIYNLLNKRITLLYFNWKPSLKDFANLQSTNSLYQFVNLFS